MKNDVKHKHTFGLNAIRLTTGPPGSDCYRAHMQYVHMLCREKLIDLEQEQQKKTLKLSAMFAWHTFAVGTQAQAQAK